jgi:hypothetical protein
MFATINTLSGSPKVHNGEVSAAGKRVVGEVNAAG